MIAIVIVNQNSKSATFKVNVYSVIPLDSNTVRIFMDFHNVGSAAGSASCVIDTKVFNQFGDEVDIEVNSTATNSGVPSHGQQRIYQDIGVNSGDAQFVKPGDVTVTDC